MDEVGASEALHRRVRAWVRGALDPRRSRGQEPFEALALDIARFQLRAVPPVARLARARGVDTEALRSLDQLPALPCDVFRLARVAAHPPELDMRVFRTSGTTQGAEARGEHCLRTTATYELCALAWGREWLFPELPRESLASLGLEASPGGSSSEGGRSSAGRVGAPPVQARGANAPQDCLILAPPPEQASDSSLGFMLELFARTLGGLGAAPVLDGVRGLQDLDGVDGPQGESTWALDQGELLLDPVIAACHRARRGGTPLLVLGTSFALVHLLDRVRGREDVDLRLPPGSRLMQTGGFKGRSREVPAEELRAGLCELFALPPSHVVSEYGMTELCSQLYELGLVRPGSPTGLHAAPPWVRVEAVDPLSLRPLPEGEVGIARITDLANVDSALIVQTADRVRVLPSEGLESCRVELLGRAAGAPPRGCSLAIEELLGWRASDSSLDSRAVGTPGASGPLEA